MPSSRCTLSINLDAIAKNWLAINAYVGKADAAAVVKADAYGLGVGPVSASLHKAGCRTFFVASFDEALNLRSHVGQGATIYLLTGVFAGEELACINHDFIPVLVSPEMLQRWLVVVKGLDSHKRSAVRAALKVDTGMGRLGCSIEYVQQLLSTPEVFTQAGIELVMSHLACADMPEHELNTQQWQHFTELRAALLTVMPSLRFSLANSAGCALGDSFHYDLVRPGIALYGGKLHDKTLHIEPVVSVNLELIQLKRVEAGQCIGYGASFQTARPSVIATLAGGYADGIFRALGNSALVYVGEQSAPVVGRISMDSTTVDLTDVTDVDSVQRVELLGAHQGIEALAEQAGTISYELLTAMGERFSRIYIEGSEVMNQAGASPQDIGLAGSEP